MILLLPDYLLRPKEVDPDFADERAVAIASGFTVCLYSHERLSPGTRPGRCAPARAWTGDRRPRCSAAG